MTAEQQTVFASEALPTRGGSYSAWQPEYMGEANGLSPDGWRSVPTERHPDGIPGSPFSDGINTAIGMCSFAQAKAIAWGYAAFHEARTGKSIPVRVVEYRVLYDIKCYRAAASLDRMAPPVVGGGT